MSKHQWSKFQSSPRHFDLPIAQGYTGNAEWSTYPIPKQPTKNCIFCKEFHWSHLCLEVSTLERRIQLFEEFGLCFLCGKREHAGSCSCGDIWCKWPQCGQKNGHNTTLCPNVDYPVTRETVRAYHHHVNYVWQMRSESSMSSFNDTSQYSRRKDRKRNRKLSSNAKTVTFGCHT